MIWQLFYGSKTEDIASMEPNESVLSPISSGDPTILSDSGLLSHERPVILHVPISSPTDVTLRIDGHGPSVEVAGSPSTLQQCRLSPATSEWEVLTPTELKSLETETFVSMIEEIQSQLEQGTPFLLAENDNDREYDEEFLQMCVEAGRGNSSGVCGGAVDCIAEDTMTQITCLDKRVIAAFQEREGDAPKARGTQLHSTLDPLSQEFTELRLMAADPASLIRRHSRMMLAERPWRVDIGAFARLCTLVD
jgi:hypothetical protein